MVLSEYAVYTAGEREGERMNQPTDDDAKKKKTKGVHFHLRHDTIDYLRGKINEDLQSVPAVGRRIIERQQRKDEKRKTGG